MNKAIFYKERIKIRRFYPLATAVLAGFTAYALLRIGRMYAFQRRGLGLAGRPRPGRRAGRPAQIPARARRRRGWDWPSFFPKSHRNG